MGECGIELVADCRKGSASFFPMLDDNIAVFVRTALINILAGKRTVGLFLRPGECFRQDRAKYVVKRILFFFLKRLRGTRILTIIPFYVEPRFQEVASGWIHEPQLWDLDLLIRGLDRKSTQLTDEIRGRCNGRRTIVALGGLDRLKGFPFFVKLWRENPTVREQYLFIAAGQVGPSCKQNALAFANAGGFLADRFISEEELMALYSIADLVWCCYGPLYNQSSGVFGRAFQFGKPALVRKESYLAAYASHLDTPALSLPFDDIEGSAEALLRWEPEQVFLEARSQKVKAMREDARETLRSAFLG
jgi:hypothetical protein